MINLLREAGLRHAIVHITGESDVGKTTMALECGALPEEIVFIDSDIKGATKVSQLASTGMQFGMYRDALNDTRGMLEIERYQYYIGVIEEIRQLDESKRRAIIFDTWEPFEKTLQPVVSKDPKKFREFYSPMGTIRGSEIWLASFDYEAEIVGELSALCDLLILVTHVKNYNVGGKRIEGKVVADCKRPVVQKSLVRIWLKHNPKSSVPIGLVMKRLGKTGYVEDKGIRTVNVLPRKITPREGDESLWDTIKYYWEHPIGNRKPEAWETPDEFELSILEGTLTEDQKLTFRLMLQGEKEADEFNEAHDAELGAKALVIYEEQGNYRAVADELGITIPEAARLVREASSGDS